MTASGREVSVQDQPTASQRSSEPDGTIAPPAIQGRHLLLLATALLLACSQILRGGASFGPRPDTQRGTPRTPLDPAAWGGNHVGKPFPEFVTGDECLFCHRNTIGTTWQANAHGITVRHREDAPALRRILTEQPKLAPVARDIEFFLGSRHRVRFLKQDARGKFALLPAQAVLTRSDQAQEWIGLESLRWDSDRFANTCAGCHTTAVDPATKTFAAFGLDCFTCHGDVTLDHTRDTSLVWWSAKRRNAKDFREIQAMTSICAQCHVREGRSRSTGLPYPNTFVAGDNLFQDFTVDFSRAEAADVNPGDRHVLRTVRDVVLYGSSTLTCLSCHRVHASSTTKHRLVPRAPVCFDCHDSQGSRLATKVYEVSSRLCEYEGVLSGRP
jgi:predicted CXXCH cytochrome family protein